MTGPGFERRARRVGAIAIVGVVIASAAMVLLADQLALRAPVRIRVVFRHTAGLRERAPLVVGGQPIGRVESISPVPHGAPGRLAGEVGVVATVAIAQDRVELVPAAAEIFVASRGPLAEKYLEVAPPRGEPGRAIRDGDELRGVDPPTLDDVLHHTWANMTKLKRFAEAVRPELAALRAEVDRLRGTLDGLAGDPAVAAAAPRLLVDGAALVAAARQTYDDALGGAPGLARLRAVTGEARRTIGALRAAIDDLAPRAATLATRIERVSADVAARGAVARAQAAIAAVRAALDRIAPLVAAVDDVADRIARGEGSLLRIARDPEFPEDTKDLGKIMKRQPWKILEHARGE